VQQRVHRATSPDGTEIVGRVEGQGPPLVLVHGAIADGDSEWARCCRTSPSTSPATCRARGAGVSSGHHPDVSREARVADIHAFVESIGEPVTMAGVSGGGMTALGVAARTSAVTALAVYEPVVLEAASDDWLEVFDQTIAGMTEAADVADPTRPSRSSPRDRQRRRAGRPRRGPGGRRGGRPLPRRRHRGAARGRPVRGAEPHGPDRSPTDRRARAAASRWCDADALVRRRLPVRRGARRRHDRARDPRGRPFRTPHGAGAAGSRAHRLLPSRLSVRLIRARRRGWTRRRRRAMLARSDRGARAWRPT
jgi:hypothetical protein